MSIAIAPPAGTGNPRRALALGLGAALALALAGCGSGPRRGRWQGAPATQIPLDLDPAGREAAVALAMLVINTPYTYGGNTPRGGFDCSGLVYYVFSQVAAGSPAARRLPRSTAQWAAVSVPVDEAALQRGDLVFFNTSGAAFSHMGIYVGQGQFVHAPSSGGTVRKDTLASGYFGQRYQGGRRVFAG